MSDQLLREEISRINEIMNNIIHEQGSADIFVDRQAMNKLGNDTYDDYIKNRNQNFERDLKSVMNFVTDPHFLLPVGAVILSVASMGTATPLAAALLAGGSVALEVADVALYWNEGNYEDAGIAAIFALIPGTQLAKMLGLRFVSELTEKEIKLFLKKIKEGLDLTEKESKLLKAIGENQTEISRVMMRQSNKAISLKIISELSGLKSWNILLEMARLGLVSWKTTWKLGIGGLSLYTLGQIGATLGDKTALSLGYKTPEGLNVNEFKKVLIDQADEQVKPFIEKL